MKRIIEQTDDGSATLFVPSLNEHYHSVKGALTESQHIFIDMGLKAVAATKPRVLEIGFGTGLNALLTLETAEREKRHIHYTGIELYPLTWQEVDALKYSDNPLFKTMHQTPWEEEVPITPYFTLKKVKADVTELNEERRMKNEELPCGVTAQPHSSISTLNSSFFVLHSSFKQNSYLSPDVIYFDAFAPEKQPEMWTEQLFSNLYAALNQGGVLTTYCAKGAIRRMLQSVGFKVERLPGPPGGKREILRASKN